MKKKKPTAVKKNIKAVKKTKPAAKKSAPKKNSKAAPKKATKPAAKKVVVAKPKKAAKPVVKKELKVKVAAPKKAEIKKIKIEKPTKAPKAPKPPKEKKIKPVKIPKLKESQKRLIREQQTAHKQVLLAMKVPTTKKKYTMEFVIKSSPIILYDFVTAPTNLAQWFADEVDRNRDIYTFTWDGSRQMAQIVIEIEDDVVRYQWVDNSIDEYFEFKVTHTEITGDTVLTITDFSEPGDEKNSQALWDSQIKTMIQRLGA